LDGIDHNVQVFLFRMLSHTVLCGVAGCLSLFSCSGGGGQCEGGVSGGEVAEPSEFPVRDDASGVFIEQLTGVFGGLLLTVKTAFTTDRAEGSGVAAALSTATAVRRVVRG
ncbi:MAG TPA: hypothetical protein VIY28_19165, partial [Pseudonocardiaceae bacterium]